MTSSADESPAGNSSKRPPDFFLVGNSKSGTTALYEMLRGHPQIFMPDMKEPAYYALDLRPRFRHPIPEPETLEDYLRLFEPAAGGQLTGDASSLYLFSSEAANAIAAARPDARIIAVLREPVSFLRSLHLQLLQNHIETERDLRVAMSLEQDRREGRRIPRSAIRPQALRYSDRVRYVEQLRRYHAVFPAEQVLVLIYEDFRADNAGTLRTVLRFLGVDDAFEPPAVQANPTVAVRSVHLEIVKERLRRGSSPGMRAARAAARTLTGERLRSRALPILRRAAYRPVGPTDPGFELELRRRLKPEVVALSDYLGRDLVSLWGYDSLG